MSRRIADDEDLSGRVSPCPIPPNPSKQRPATDPQSSSGLVTSRRIWGWLVSPRFAGWCGIGAMVAVLLSITTAYFLFGFPGINQYQPFSIAHLAYGVAGMLLIIFMVQVFRIQIRFRSYLGMLAGLLGVLMGGVIIYQAWVRAETLLSGIIAQAVYHLSWLWILVLPVFMAFAFSPLFLGLDRQSGVIFILALGASILTCFNGLFVIANGFFLTIIQGFILNLIASSWILLFSVLLIIRGEYLLQTQF
jgi:hypothetical protein